MLSFTTWRDCLCSAGLTSADTGTHCLVWGILKGNQEGIFLFFYAVCLKMICWKEMSGTPIPSSYWRIERGKMYSISVYMLYHFPYQCLLLPPPPHVCLSVLSWFFPLFFLFILFACTLSDKQKHTNLSPIFCCVFFFFTWLTFRKSLKENWIGKKKKKRKNRNKSQ